MDSELLDKEVLCIIDIRQIQKFIFHSNKTIDTLGASVIMKSILEDALLYAVKNIESPLKDNQYDLLMNPDIKTVPYFNDENVLIQLIINSAGNAQIIFRTGELCQKVVRKVSRYLLDTTYALEIASCAVARTDSNIVDNNALYRKLDLVKADFPSAHLLLPPAIVKKEKNTGEAVYKIDKDGEAISKSTYIRRKLAIQAHDTMDMKQVHSEKGPNDAKYLAVLHIDGNNMGMTIGKIMPKAKSYEDTVKIRRLIDKNIDQGYTNTLSNTLAWLKKEYYPDGISEEEFSKEFLVFHRGGDDLNIVCAPRLAIPFVERFVEELKNAYLWNDDELKVNFSICGGVAFVFRDYPFIPAFDLAEECCSNAKKFAKKAENSINGLSGNWFDFEIQMDDRVPDIDHNREQYYKTSENINMLLKTP